VADDDWTEMFGSSKKGEKNKGGGGGGMDSAKMGMASSMMSDKRSKREMKGKKGTDVMIALLGGPKGEHEAEGDDTPEMEAAAQRLIDGVKSGNAKKVSLALSEHYSLCQAEEAGESEEEEMDEEKPEDY